MNKILFVGLSLKYVSFCKALSKWRYFTHPKSKPFCYFNICHGLIHRNKTRTIPFHVLYAKLQFTSTTGCYARSSVEINDLIRLLFSIESRVALQNSRCVQIQTTEYGWSSLFKHQVIQFNHLCPLGWNLWRLHYWTHTCMHYSSFTGGIYNIKVLPNYNSMAY